MDSDLDITVRNALVSRRGEWLTIAKHAEVSHSWLSKFVNGHIPNPGFGTLKRIANYLAAERHQEAPHV